VLEGEYIIFLDGREFSVPGRVLHLHPGRTPPWLQGGPGGQPKAESQHPRCNGRLFPRFERSDPSRCC
jgi:hypothetical protein